MSKKDSSLIKPKMLLVIAVLLTIGIIVMSIVSLILDIPP